MYRVMYNSNPPYVSCRAGVYYYTRRVPIDVRQYYASPRLSFSLRTKSYAGAVRAAQSVTQRLEDYWLGLRLQDMDIPAIHLVRADGVAYDAPVILDAVENYLKLKGNDDRTFMRTARRNGDYVAKLLGNRPITSYSTAEAAQFRDWCFDKGMGLNTVKRVFASVRSVINLNIREYGLQGGNAFSGTYMPNLNHISLKRKPLPLEILKLVQNQCRETDDEARWLTLLLSETGMRLSEAAGLVKEDIHLDKQLPYLEIKPHEWRRLKTNSSQRRLPLVGHSLWAVRRAYIASNGPFMFPKYCNENGCKSNSASAALNKWLKGLAGPNYVIHSFRHALRDRLREVNCPTDMIDQIGGWRRKSVGETYGEGYNLEQVYEWLNKISL